MAKIIKQNSSYPIGSFVELFTSENKRKTLRVRCILQKDKKILCQGDPDLIKMLEKGIPIVVGNEPQYYQPKDGIKFLLALTAHFDSPYLFAGEIQTPNTSL